jgi:hypothetical protein
MPIGIVRQPRCNREDGTQSRASLEERGVSRHRHAEGRPGGVADTLAYRPRGDLELCGGESFAAWRGCLDDLVASGQIKLRRIDGWRKIAAVLKRHMAVAA